MELLRTDQILAQIATDMAIEYQVRGGEMKRPEAEKHFKQREALAIVREMVLDKGEHLAGISG